jgi:cytochrome c peroxidase
MSATRLATALIVGCAVLVAAGRQASTQGALAALPPLPDAPVDNPSTPEKVALGRLLFWDPVLSGNRDVACATCHHPNFAYAENRDLSIGVSGVGLGAARHFAAGSARSMPPPRLIQMRALWPRVARTSAPRVWPRAIIS